jgi:hypothetical protein
MEIIDWWNSFPLKRSNYPPNNISKQIRQSRRVWRKRQPRRFHDSRLPRWASKIEWFLRRVQDLSQDRSQCEWCSWSISLPNPQVKSQGFCSQQNRQRWRKKPKHAWPLPGINCFGLLVEQEHWQLQVAW